MISFRLIISEEWATVPSGWKKKFEGHPLFQGAGSSEEDEEEEKPFNLAEKSGISEEFRQAIEHGIKELGGKVFIRTNWKAPIVSNSLLSCFLTVSDRMPHG